MFPRACSVPRDCHAKQDGQLKRQYEKRKIQALAQGPKLPGKAEMSYGIREVLVALTSILLVAEGRSVKPFEKLGPDAFRNIVSKHLCLLAFDSRTVDHKSALFCFPRTI